MGLQRPVFFGAPAVEGADFRSKIRPPTRGDGAVNALESIRAAHLRREHEDRVVVQMPRS
jgi:hypothetical protein